jgi:hypothetical protein
MQYLFMDLNVAHFLYFINHKFLIWLVIGDMSRETGETHSTVPTESQKFAAPFHS